MRTNIEQYVGLSEFPFVVSVKPLGYDEKNSIEVYDGDTRLFSFCLSRYHSASDCAQIVKDVLKWCLSPMRLMASEIAILRPLWKEGYRYIRKDEDDKSGHPTIVVTTDLTKESRTLEAFNYALPSLDKGDWISIGSLLGKEDTDDKNTH